MDDLVRRFAERAEVERVILFGSRARGDGDARSDIDLAVEVPGAAAGVWADLRDMADEARTLLDLDLVRLDQTWTPLRRRILEEGEVLYEKRRG